MGLDMYAHRRLYTKKWDHHKPEDSYSVQVERGGKPVAGLCHENIVLVEEEVMYWRKANHIHAWFVEHVQDGADDCRQYRVDKDKLVKLLDTCQEVINASTLVQGTTANGYILENGERVYQRQPGRVIEDATVAKRLLPTKEGFFFGTVEYDEWYLANVEMTRDWLDSTIEAMKEANHDFHIFYSSSW